MTPEKKEDSIRIKNETDRLPENEHLNNVIRGVTFEASHKIEETTIDEKAEEPKRVVVRKRPLRTARPGRSRKRT